VKNVIKLKTKLQLAVDLVKEINLRFEEFQLGDHSISRQVQTRVSRNRRNRSAVDTSVTSQDLLRHQCCLLLPLSRRGHSRDEAPSGSLLAFARDDVGASTPQPLSDPLQAGIRFSE
jgi:hypothetical protein